MITLSAQQARQIAALLDDARTIADELAAEHLIRRDAWLSARPKDKIMAAYHRNHADSAHASADQFAAAALKLRSAAPGRLRTTA